MDLTKEKERIKAWVDAADEDTIDLLKQIQFGETEMTDWWDELTDDQRQQIEEGQKDVDEGRVTSHADVKKRYGL